MTIRALLFDLWGTLLYIRDVEDMEARCRRLLDRTVLGLANAGHPYAEETVAAALTKFGDEHSAMHREGRDISQPERLALVLERIEPGLASRMSGAALLAFEDAVADVRLRDRKDRTFPAPGALAAVEEARGRGLALGLISVTGLTPGYVLRDVLDRSREKLEELHGETERYTGPFELPGPGEAQVAWVRELMERQQL